MERHEYEVMFSQEEDYWWYLGLRDIVFRYLNPFIGRNKSAMILDAGAGTGKLLEMCKDYRAWGLEFSEHAFPFLKLRGLRNVVRSSICSIPFKDQAFHCVVSLDVLYHAGVENDADALVEIHRVLKSDGLLILNLPAFEFLRSRHDLAVHTRRRYQTEELRRKLEKAGFCVERITYRNTILFPIVALVRFIKKMIPKQDTGQGIKSDLYRLPLWINKLLYQILILENKRLLRGLTFPFGLSVFCIAKAGHTPNPG